MIPPCSADVVVLGGGPAGSVCARELALRGCTVRLVAGTAMSPRRFGETASGGFVRLLASHGLSMPEAGGDRLTSFGSSWGSDSLHVGVRQWLGVDATRALSRTELDAWLRNEASKAGAVVMRGAVAQTAIHDGAAWRLAVRDGEGEHLVSGRVVVEATGRGARSICYADVRRLYTDRLACICVTPASARTSRTEALVEAETDGWWYALADRKARSFVAYFTDADHIPAAALRRQWLDARYQATRHVRELIGDSLSWESGPCLHDARTSVRTVLVRNHWLAIGDAAWTLDPLSGRGVERAVRCAMDASRAIAEAIDTGAAGPLLEYARQQVNAFTDALGRQRQVYGEERRFDSTFWARRHVPAFH